MTLLEITEPVVTAATTTNTDVNSALTSIWNGFSALYNSSPAFQTIILASFWGIVLLILLGVISKKDKDKKTASGPTDPKNIYWKNKKDLYDKLRKTTRDFGNSYSTLLNSEFYRRALEVGVPSKYLFSWEEAKDWNSFFSALGTRVLTQLFDDIENNGFETIADEEVESFLSHKVALQRGKIYQAVTEEFQQEIFHRGPQGDFYSRTRIMTYGEISLIIEKAMSFLELEVRKIYKTAIDEAKKVQRLIEED